MYVTYLIPLGTCDPNEETRKTKFYILYGLKYKITIEAVS